MASDIHHCKDCGMFFESGKSLEVHLQYHKENLLSRWASQAAESANEKNNSARNNSNNRNTNQTDFVEAVDRTESPSNRSVSRSSPANMNNMQYSPQFDTPSTPNQHQQPPPLSSFTATETNTTDSINKSGYTFHRPMPQLATMSQPLPGYGTIMPTNNGPPGFPPTTSYQDTFESFKQHPPQRRDYRFHPYNGSLQPQIPNHHMPAPPMFPPNGNGLPLFDPNYQNMHQLNKGIHPGYPPPEFMYFPDRHHPGPNGVEQQTNGENPPPPPPVSSAAESAEILDLDSQKVVYQGTNGNNGLPPSNSPLSQQQNTYPTPPPSGWGHPQWKNEDIKPNSPYQPAPQINHNLNSYTPPPPVNSYPPPPPHHHLPPPTQQPPPMQMPPQHAPPMPDSSTPSTPTTTQSNVPVSPSPNTNTGWSKGSHHEAKRPKTYYCQICNKWFTSSGHLKRHYNTTLHKNALKTRGLPPGSETTINSHIVHQNGRNNTDPASPLTHQPSPLPASPMVQHPGGNQGENLSPPGCLAAASGGPVISSTISETRIVSAAANNINNNNNITDHSGNNVINCVIPYPQQPGNHVQHPPAPMMPDFPMTHKDNYMPHSYPMPYSNGLLTIATEQPNNRLTNNCYNYQPQNPFDDVNGNDRLQNGSMYQLNNKDDGSYHESSPQDVSDEDNYSGSIDSADDMMNELSPEFNPMEVQNNMELYRPGYDDENDIKSDLPPQKNPLKRVALRCDECGISFKKISTMAMHNKQVHGGNGMINCEPCSLSFTDKQLYDAHMKRTHDGPRLYPCTLCNKNFNHRTDLKRHLCTHTGQRPFECGQCKKRFIRKDHMKKHYEKHLNGSPTDVTDFDSDSYVTSS